MALYDLEITETPSSAKALKRISALSGISEREIKAKLQYVPFVIKSSLALSEAIEIERQLKRFGVQTRLVRVDADEDELEYEEVDEVIEPEELNPEDVNEVIEIPENEVLVLLPQEVDSTASEFKRRKLNARNVWLGWSAVAIFFLAVIFGSWYVIATSNKHQKEVEINLYIQQWVHTLKQQDLLLDKGFPPDRIFYKLDDLDAKVNRLLTDFRPVVKARQLRTQFNRLKSDNREFVRDLAFRESLENDGYPIHPTCSVDRGMVRGSSELPESTLLRIKLLGEDNLETVYYAARISGGTFKLIIDPGIESKIYDAFATVASYSQQPKEIQRWAERKFSLESFCDNYLPHPQKTPTRQRQTAAMQPEQPPSSTMKSEFQSAEPESGIPLSDPGNDLARAKELEKTLTSWTETMLQSEGKTFTDHPEVLAQIYHRLLNLEVRIDQLIGLLESPMERNIWVERREDVYGSFVNERQKISELYKSSKKMDNPFKMESKLRDDLRSSGFPQADVLVVDAPDVSGAFVIEIEIYHGNQEDILLAVAEKIQEAVRNSSLRIERVRLRTAGETLRWTTDQILQAAEELKAEGGRKRCVAKLELSAITQSTP